MKHNRYIAPTKKQKPADTGLSIIVLAAGKSKNIQGPISLKYIKTGQPLIEYQNNILRHQFPNANLLFVIGEDHQNICKKYPKIRYLINHEYENTGPMGSLNLGLLATDEKRSLVISGDMFFNTALLQIIHLYESCVLYDNTKQLGDKKAGLTYNENSVIHFSYGLASKWAQITLLGEQELVLLRKQMFKESAANKHLFEHFNEVIEAGGSFLPLEIPEESLTELDSKKAGNILL